MKISNLLVIGLLIGAGPAAGCRRTDIYQKPLKPVRVHAVENYYPDRSTGSGERYSANIRPAMQIDLAFKNGGYIDQIHQVKGADGRIRSVQEGDWVAKGTVLARLRDADFAAKVKQAESLLSESQSALSASKAQQSEADSALEQAQKDLDRATRLIESRSITKVEFDAARTRHSIAQAKVEAARAQGKVVEAKIAGAQSLLSEARLARQDATLHAPMNSIVLRRTVEPGSLVAPGTPIFVLTDVSSVKAVFGVPDLTVKSIKPGAKLTLTTEAIPGANLIGTITRISPTADPRSRVFEVEVTIPRPPTQLRLGMIASVELPGAKPSETITVIPLNAIVRPKDNPNAYAVNVVTNEGGKQVAHLRPVKLGEVFGNMIAVSEGIKLGEAVIISGASMIVDGEQVRVIP